MASPSTPSVAPPNAGFQDHDHHHCIASAMSAAENSCETNGLRLTPVRRRTLEILLEAHEALGAYDVLARLDRDGFGSKPPVAYRALTFLVDAGLAHRIERLNAFVACTHSDKTDHAPAFLICTSCGTVAESEAGSAMQKPAAAAGFQIERTVLEAEGICPSCQDI